MSDTGPVELVARRLLTLARHHYDPFQPELPWATANPNPDHAGWVVMASPGDFEWTGDSTWTVNIPGPKGGGTLVLVGETGVRVGSRPPTAFRDLDAVMEWGGLIPWEDPLFGEQVAAAITEHTAWVGAPPFPEDWMEVGL